MSMWGSEGHHWVCLMLPVPSGLLLPAHGCWWCCSCQEQPLRVLSSLHAQTVCRVRQDDCLLALRVCMPEFCADSVPGQPVTCPCNHKKTAWPPSLLSKMFQVFCQGKTGINYYQLSPLEQTEQAALILQLWVTPLDGGKGRQGWWCNAYLFQVPHLPRRKSRLYCQAKLIDHLFRKVSQGQWAQICGWAAKKVEDRWALGEQRDLELSHAVLESNLVLRRVRHSNIIPTLLSHLFIQLWEEHKYIRDTFFPKIPSKGILSSRHREEKRQL